MAMLADPLGLAGLDDLHAALCRADLLAWCEHAAPAPPAAHHRLLIAELQRLAETPRGRLMVMMPPGSAKSTYASVLFPAWYLAGGARAVIAASHTADLAEAFSRRVQRMVAEHADTLGVGLASESVQAWETTGGGVYKAAGVGGPITGRRADLAIIDDPVKSRQDADSETYRERAWDWWMADLSTRLRPAGRVVLIMTRWHEDDLAGRLLATQGDRWRVLRLPALAEDGDALGRAPGAPLWGDDAYGYGAVLAERRAEYESSGSMRDWWALYQQSPRAPEGLLFQIARLGVLDAAPVGGRDVRAWDLAATAEAGDWTAGARLRRLDDGRLVVLDVVRLRGGPDAVEAAIVATAQQDGRAVRISLPQDPGQAGKAQVAYLTRRLAGFVVESSPETGDKATRAAPLAAQINVGNVALARGGWNAALLAELRDFPTGSHDDQVDALARAFNVLTSAPAPARRAAMNIMAR